MASLSFYPQFETNLMSNRKVIELLLQLKSAKAPGKNYIKVKPHLSAILCVIVYQFYRQRPKVSVCSAPNVLTLIDDHTKNGGP